MPLTPAFEAGVYKQRRDEVLRRMRELAPSPSVAIFPAMPVATRNSDVEHAYRADSDLYWLTGFEEPEAVAVLATGGDKPFTLFVRPRDKEKEIWTGRRAGVDGAMKSFGADQAFEVSKLDEELPKLLGSARTLFYRIGGDDPEFDLRISRMLRNLRARARAGVNAPPRIEDPGQIVHELRLRKEPREIDALHRAVELTRKGHLACMQAGRPGAHEYDLHAHPRARVPAERRAGMGLLPDRGGRRERHRPALHRQPRRRSATASWSWSTPARSTISTPRTSRGRFPPRGDSREPQRACYQLVLDAADACIAATRPGETIDGLHEKAVRILTAGMVKLGLLKGDVEALIKENAFRRYYMHRTSHWLGLDVHDVGQLHASTASRARSSRGWCSPSSPGCTSRATTRARRRSCAASGSASRTTSW